MRRHLTALAVFLLFMPLPGRTAEFGDGDVAQASLELLQGGRSMAQAAAERLIARGRPDVVASLILGMRYRHDLDDLYGRTFEALTGETATGWYEAMLWQERHPEVRPHASYRQIKLALLARIDARFLEFFDTTDSGKMRIRLEEITWGGVPVDGIPSLDAPKMIPAAEADYLAADDLVFAVSINGDARAYPLRIMGWHEMFNDVVGGVPVALAYCTLCGAGILFETLAAPRTKPFVFGSSGLLYRSNKLMFDRETSSLWNQFTGEPVAGPLVESGIRLPIRPVAITSWAEWRRRHPETRVLSLDTGHHRDYGSGVVYRDYFASPDLMFPTRVGDEGRVRRKDYVFGMRGRGTARAWPLSAFEGGRVINDAIGDTGVVLIGDAATRTVRAYARAEHRFERGPAEAAVEGPGGLWRIEEDALVGPAGKRLRRLPGHIAYWFAWDGYMGVRSSLYPDDE
ncbi:MAG: DUF3179 domain-containing protein [Alphaproteobacteria bacterium]|jgi:hypothetical protein|nr:DUF3179 domain-containing protein [Alphaproteobacteria bacterium]